MKKKYSGHIKTFLIIMVAGILLVWFFQGNRQTTALRSESSQPDGLGTPSAASRAGDAPASPTSANAETKLSPSTNRPLPPSLMPFALSPGTMSLGDSVQDVLTRSDGIQALKLGRILAECVTIRGRELAIDLERSHPSGDAAYHERRLKALSDQLTRVKAECQTVPGNPSDKLMQLAELAYSKQVPGAAQMLLSLRPGQATQEQLERLAQDARAGEWLSVMSASVADQAPVSKSERVEMLLALQRTYEETKPIGSNFDLMYRRLLDRVWSTPASGGPATMNVPQGQGRQRPSSETLPPEFVMPTDAQAAARIEQLTTQLTRQVKEMQDARIAAIRRAGGG